jgi:peptide/nickel transport system permease protein
VRHRSFATTLGFVCLGAFLLLATVGRLHGDPTELVTLGAEPPSLAHPFGTDTLGRDVFDRPAAAAWTSTLVSVAAVGLALVVAVPLGMWAGFRHGRRTDGIVMRGIEVTQALPAFVLVIFLLGVMGSGNQEWGPVTVDPETRIALCLAIAFVPFFARVARSATVTEMQLDYPTGLRALGVPRREIVFGELLPNVLPPLRVQALLALGIAVFAEGGLSFLGLGVPPPQPTLGNLLADASPQVLDGTWWYALLPGVVLVIGILGCNLVGDVRERL